MWFGVITLFPDMFQALNAGITSRAMREKRLTLALWNPRDFATDKHNSVDDHPYGGGPGMVMMAEPLCAAIRAAKLAAPSTPRVIYLSPQGKAFTQEAAVELYNHQSLIFIAGRYEGIDERIIQQEVDEEWSIGDYVLTGGELAAMVMIDTISRLIPGTVGDEESVNQDSLTSGLLKYPQYTRPENYNNQPVPDVLLSGHHKQIASWRRKQSLGRTWQKRPDILAKMTLNREDSGLLAEFIEEYTAKAR